MSQAQLVSQRNGAMWLIISLITFGIGAFIYMILTWGDMHRAATHINQTKGTQITTWSPIVWFILSLIPLVNIYAFYRFWAANKEMAQAVGTDAIEPILGFLVSVFLPFIGIFLIFLSHRNTLNEIARRL